MKPFRIVLLALLALSFEAAAQLTVVLTPNPAVEGQRIRARVTGLQSPASATQGPLVRVDQGVVSLYLGRECFFLCPPPTDPIDVDLALPLLNPGVYQVQAYFGPSAAPGTLQATATLVVNPAGAAICVTGLWWSSPANSESGWGLALDHQGDVIFAVWFTYDDAGRATWFTIPGARRTQTVGAYSGPIYRNSGPPYHQEPWDPSKVSGAQVGTGTITFSNETFGRFDYTIDGHAGTKFITRQIFATPVSRCSF